MAPDSALIGIQCAVSAVKYLLVFRGTKWMKSAPHLLCNDEVYLTCTLNRARLHRTRLLLYSHRPQEEGGQRSTFNLTGP